MASAAPKVFISYSHDPGGHKDRVLSLAERLRADGIDTQIDQYIAGTPREGWPRWMLNQLDWADFTLVICTEVYYRRFRGHDESETGRGADFEGSLITFEIYKTKSRTTKFVPVLFSQEDEKFIPEPLRIHSNYVLNSDQQYDELYRFLTGHAGVPPGNLGPLKTLAHKQVSPLKFEISGTEQSSARALPDSPVGHDARQTHFLEVAKRVSNQIDSSYLQRCQFQINDGLFEAECGATFADTLGNHTREETLGLISNGIKKFQMTLPANIRQAVLSLCEISEGADSELMKLLRGSIRGLLHPALCGWILLEALRNKDLALLSAVRALSIDSVAIDSFSAPYAKQRKLTDLSAALELLSQ